MPKVFIYKSSFTAQESISDLKELFTSYGIFESVNVMESDFNFNVDGLNGRDITFIIPGGQAMGMGMELKPRMEKMKSHFGNQFNYVGICAGAYIAPSEADIFNTNYKIDQNTKLLAAPEYVGHSSDFEADLNIVSEYKAFGPFYPSEQDVDYSPMKGKLIPYCVNLALTNSHCNISQLYVSGCGFESVASSSADKKTTEAIATYTSENPYKFFYPDDRSEKKIQRLSAMISRPANAETHSGGVFLAGTHIEACVKNSRMLSSFSPTKKADAKQMLLSKESHKLLEDSQEEAAKVVVTLLKDTFKPR